MVTVTVTVVVTVTVTVRVRKNRPVQDGCLLDAFRMHVGCMSDGGQMGVRWGSNGFLRHRILRRLFCVFKIVMGLLHDLPCIRSVLDDASPHHHISDLCQMVHPRDDNWHIWPWVQS